MALGTTAAVLLALGAGGAAVGVSKLMQPKQQALSAPLPLPQAPTADAAAAKADDVVRRKRSDVTQTTFTSPLGIGGQADINKKIVLGQ